VIIPYFLGWKFQEAYLFPFDVLVQVGSLFALIIYFWRDLLLIVQAFLQGLIQKKPFQDTNSRLGWLIILATIPAGLFGLLVKDAIEKAFTTPKLAAWFLLGTAALLVIAEIFSKANRSNREMTWLDSLWIGVFQAFSVFPGISRSGSTLAGGMIRNLNRSEATRFAFLMAIPIMLAAGMLASIDLIKTPGFTQYLPVFGAGFFTSVLISYLAIRWFLNYVKNHSLYIFAIYCTILSLAALLF
jgi:undecaprenyl-diphosphatase